MNQGGEPGHDDYGLPPVDIQIPDDARELYRDVQAYHRELRAIRRHERSRRWRAPLRRSGMVLPLIAGCLVLAMIASMVLTMFSANPEFSGIAGQEPPSRAANGGHRSHAGSVAPPRSTAGSTTVAPPGGRAGGARPPSAGPSSTAGVALPSKTITVAGKPVPLRGLTSTALAIVPSHCRCASLIGQLLTQARSAGVHVFLVGQRGSGAELTSYLSSAGPDPSNTAIVAIDPNNVLRSTYRPVGLTILFVDSHGSVTALGLRSGFSIAQQLRSVKPSG